MTYSLQLNRAKSEESILGIGSTNHKSWFDYKSSSPVYIDEYADDPHLEK